MSASDKKKLRKELEASALTDKQQAQKKADKQLKTYTMTFLVIMVLVVAIAVSSMGINWYNNSGIPARNTVAVTIDGTELNNADLNYFYIDTINNFYNSLYSQYSTYTNVYAQYLYGLDLTAPLNIQYYNEETGETWADYFISSAIDSAKATYALYNAAVGANFELPEEYETQVNAALASTRAMAGLRGFKTMEEYLKASYGNGADEESYVKYFTINATADAYYAQYADSLLYSPTQIETYNTEHFNDFSSFDYSYIYLNSKSYLPKEEAKTEGTDSTEPTKAVEPTEEDRAAAIAAAKADADILAGATTLEELNKRIAELSWATETTDAEEINFSSYTAIAELYRDWVSDTARKPGEATVVQYESSSDEDEIVDGYYVILFEGRKDHNELMRSARHMLVMFEGGKTENGVTVYSDEEKAAAKEKAETIYNQWLNGDANEESFAAMVSSETTDDGGSVNNGGLYTNIYEGLMVTNFNDWVFDEARQPGDHGIIETEIGYHVMYFVEVQDQTYREYMVENTLRRNDVTEWYEDLLETVTATEGNTNHIYKSLIIAPATAA